MPHTHTQPFTKSGCQSDNHFWNKQPLIELMSKQSDQTRIWKVDETWNRGKIAQWRFQLTLSAVIITSKHWLSPRQWHRRSVAAGKRHDESVSWQNANTISVIWHNLENWRQVCISRAQTNVLSLKPLASSSSIRAIHDKSLQLCLSSI